MSFQDLSDRGAAAMKPKPAETATTSAKENEPKAAGTEAPAISKTS